MNIRSIAFSKYSNYMYDENDRRCIYSVNMNPSGENEEV